MAVGVLIDIERPRVQRSVMAMRADGNTWDAYDLATGTPRDADVFVDPISKTAMLCPRSASPDWDTTATGDYARLALADYETEAGTALTSAHWVENHRRIPGDIYLENRGVNYAVFTRDTWTANRGFYLSLFLPQGTGAGEVSLQFGWGEIGAEGSVGVWVLASGRALVYKRAAGDSASLLKGEYSVGSSVTVRKAPATAGAPKGDIVGRVINLHAIPCRRRDLLVFTTGGGGFVHSFADLDPEEVNMITPAGRFWWRVPSGKASVQAAPLTYPEAGTLYSLPYPLREPVESGATVVAEFGSDQAGYGTTAFTSSLVDATSGAAWTPGTAADALRIKAELSGDGVATPFLSYVLRTINPLVVNTADDEADVADQVREVSVTVGEDPASVSGRVLFKPGGHKAEIFADRDITRRNNRPVRITVDGKELVTGRLLRPALDEGKWTDDAADVLEAELRDQWAQLEACTFEEEPTPLDGLTVTDAIERLLDWAGIPDEERDIEAAAYTIPITTGVSQGEWSYQPRVGDTVAKWLLRLWRDFAVEWFMGFVPTATGPVFRFRSPSGMGTTHKAEIFVDRFGDDERLACRRFREETLPPAATRVAVIGYDPRLQQYYRFREIIPELEDPTDASADGWVGEVCPVGVYDPRLSTADAVERFGENLVEALTVPLYLADWDSNLLLDEDGVPLWKGDVVRVQPFGDYRILSFSGVLRREYAASEGGGAPIRRWSYVGKWIADIPEEEIITGDEEEEEDEEE